MPYIYSFGKGYEEGPKLKVGGFVGVVGLMGEVGTNSPNWEAPSSTNGLYMIIKLRDPDQIREDW